MDDSHGSGQQAQMAQMREVGGMYYDARAQARGLRSSNYDRPGVP